MTCEDTDASKTTVTIMYYMYLEGWTLDCLKVTSEWNFVYSPVWKCPLSCTTKSLLATVEVSYTIEEIKPGHKNLERQEQLPYPKLL
jgi:hypothetical protein